MSINTLFGTSNKETTVKIGSKLKHYVWYLTSSLRFQWSKHKQECRLIVETKSLILIWVCVWKTGLTTGLT